MKKEQIQDSDTVARLLYDPKDVILADAAIPQLTPLNDNNLQFTSDSGRRESVTCIRLLGDKAVEKCHELGVTKQDRDNERLSKLSAGKNRTFKPRTYVGYGSANVGAIRGCRLEGMSFDVIHEPLTENYAHCDIVMLNGDEVPAKLKTVAVRAVQGCFRDSVSS